MTTKISRNNINDTAYYDIVGPEFTSLVYPGVQTSANTAGGDTITVNGQGFKSGLSVVANSKIASVVTFINSSQITFTAPANPAGTYILFITNPNGSFAVAPGFSYS
jgi:hypothetical protein